MSVRVAMRMPPPTSAQVPHGEPAVADGAVPADEVVANKEPAVAVVEDGAVPADGAAADKEKKEKQHAEIVAKRHKAALAKKKRDEKREAKAAAAREEETDEEVEPAAEPAQVEPEAAEANETVAMEADEAGEAGAARDETAKVVACEGRGRADEVWRRLGDVCRGERQRNRRG